MSSLYESPGELFLRTKNLDQLTFKKRYIELHCAGMPVEGRANILASEYVLLSPLIWESIGFPAGHLYLDGRVLGSQERRRPEHLLAEEPALTISADTVQPFRYLGLRVLISNFYTWWRREYGESALLESPSPQLCSFVSPAGTRERLK